MSNKYFFNCFLGVAVFLASCSGPNLRSDDLQLTLIYSGNMNGELEPCGCSEGGDLGGVKRRATLLQDLRQHNPELIVVSGGGLVAHESSRDRLRSAFLLTGLATMQYDAIAVQWQDLAYGTGFIDAAPLPWVASNWLGESINKQRIIERPGISLAFFSWLDPDKDPSGKMQAAQPKVDGNTGALLQHLAKAKAAGHLTLLSTTYSLPQVQEKIPLGDVDILLIEASYEVFGPPQHINHTLVLQPGSRGMRLGRADLRVSGNRITGFTHEVIPMPKSIPDAANLAQWYEQYNSQVKAEYLKRSAIRKAMRAGASVYAGVEVCGQCHQAAHEKWSASEHAKAFADLEAVGKSFDPDCIVCHTVGFEQDGGFIDLAMTENLINVQCENCHGAGQAHAEAGGTKPLGNKGWTPAQMCAQCHIGSHSPDFNLQVYWPKIAHGK